MDRAFSNKVCAEERTLVRVLCLTGPDLHLGGVDEFIARGTRRQELEIKRKRFQDGKVGEDELGLRLSVVIEGSDKSGKADDEVQKLIADTLSD